MRKRKHSLSEQRAVGRRIRLARKASGVTAQAVADAANITRNHYYVIERGAAMPTNPTLSRIARVTGVSVDYLLTGNGDAPPQTHDAAAQAKHAGQASETAGTQVRSGEGRSRAGGSPVRKRGKRS